MDTLEQIFELGIHGQNRVVLRNFPSRTGKGPRFRGSSPRIPDLNNVKLLILTERNKLKSLERFTILRVILAQGPC